MKKYLLFIITALSFMLINTSQAESLPAYYPDAFQVLGVLERIDNEHSILIINDRKLNISSHLKVSTPRNRSTTIRALRTGMLVGANPSGAHADQIWVLPHRFKPRQNVMPIPK